MGVSLSLVGNVDEIMRERTVRMGQTAMVTKGACSNASGAVYGAVPFQFYMLGGLWWMLPIAYVYARLAFGAWAWASKVVTDPRRVVLSAILFLSLGWLAYNVFLTTMELPGILLAVGLLKILPVTAPEVGRWSSRPPAACVDAS